MTRLRRGAPLALPLCWFLVSLVPSGITSGCGARTGLRVDDAGVDAAPDDPPDASDGGPDADADATSEPKPQVECELDLDCFDEIDKCSPVHCVENVCIQDPPKVCDDEDPCTKDGCEAASGNCTHAPLTFDLDKDGHKGPAPGHKAGDPGSCGDDCDDTSAAAFPGNPEICDGVDNDCNGVVDDNAKYVPVGGAPVQVSEPGLSKAHAGGIAFAGKPGGYLASYSALTGGDTDLVVRTIDALGNPGPTSTPVNFTTGDAFPGPMVWTGDRYGMAWPDRRDGDWEIYFNTFAPDGAKLGPDVRVTDQPGFSLSPSLVWAGTSFLLAWQDDNDSPLTGSLIYGRQLALDGTFIGEELQLTDQLDTESPSLAASPLAAGFAYRKGTSLEAEVLFQPLGLDFKPKGAPVTLAGGGENYEAPTLIWNGSTFVATWNQKQPFSVFGAVLSPTGAVQVPKTELSPPGGSQRWVTGLPLGDRVIVVYGEQAADGYNLFSRTFSSALAPLSDPQQLTSSPGDDEVSAVVFGPGGDVGVFFTGRVQAQPKGLKDAAFFTRLQCQAGK
jgi:hypothetical protein